MMIINIEGLNVFIDLQFLSNDFEYSMDNQQQVYLN